MLGLPYIHHKKRGHFPPIDHKKDDISAKRGLRKKAYCINSYNLIK
jgi:hypothetical protein